MGRKLDALLGRNFRTSKIKTLSKLALSRIAILKNQHQARYSQARSDVMEILHLGQQERALGRVEYVIEEKNMLDALVMIEDYCHLLIERVVLIENKKECPDELKEAISSLIFASSRCGEFPEIQKIREVFTLMFGKEFAACAVELRKESRVNIKIVQRFSSRQSSLENRVKVLKKISSETGINLQIEENALVSVKEKLEFEQKQPMPTELPTCNNDPDLKDDAHNFPEVLNPDENLSVSVKSRINYRDVAVAAHDAFESAIYAAPAAKAAIELSRDESQDDASDDQGGSSHLPRTVSNSDRSNSVDNFGSESEGEDMTEINSKIHLEEVEESERKVGEGRTLYALSLDSDSGVLSGNIQFSSSQSRNEQVRNEVASEDLGNDSGKNQGHNIPWKKHGDLDFHRKPSLHSIDNGVDEHYPSDGNIDNKRQLPTADSLKSLNDPNETKITNTKCFVELLHSQHSSIDWKELSVRTRRVQRV